jgi:hypothetical protein
VVPLSSSLTIARDEPNGMLLVWYGAPAGCDLEDERIWRATNPASWVRMRELRRQLHDPGLGEREFRRLHLNQWVQSRDAWLPDGCWDDLATEMEIRIVRRSISGSTSWSSTTPRPSAGRTRTATAGSSSAPTSGRPATTLPPTPTSMSSNRSRPTSASLAAAVKCKGRTRQSAGPPLSLLYGFCRYGTRTSQRRLKSLRRSGCGPCSPDNVVEMKSPTALFGSPVYS